MKVEAMKEFEERQRELFKGHIKTNIAVFTRTSDATMTILSTRKLTGRANVTGIAQSLAIARQPAWALISMNLHTQLLQLIRETSAHLGTQFGVMIPIDLRYIADKPVLGLTIPRWLDAAEMSEGHRVIKALKLGLSDNLTALDSITRNAPYSQTNSSISAATVTAAASVMNSVALEIYKLAGYKRYKLETSGEIKNPSAYELEYGVDEEPRAPAYIGDRSYPVPS